MSLLKHNVYIHIYINTHISILLYKYIDMCLYVLTDRSPTTINVIQTVTISLLKHNINLHSKIDIYEFKSI
jgi:hypothetical protein